MTPGGATNRFAGPRVTSGTMGRRFVAARELCGLSLTEAAHALGYATGARLSLIEAGRKKPGVALLIHAADTYGVSSDFLLGLSDEPDGDWVMALLAALRGADRCMEQVAVRVDELLAAIESAARDAAMPGDTERAEPALVRSAVVARRLICRLMVAARDESISRS